MIESKELYQAHIILANIIKMYIMFIVQSRAHTL
jgi:hypothetical protein